MEASPSAERVLGTATLGSAESAIPPEPGKRALANCCGPIAVVTVAATPRADSVPDCAVLRAGASATALMTASVRKRDHVGAVIVQCPSLCSWMLPPVRFPASS